MHVLKKIAVATGVVAAAAVSVALAVPASADTGSRAGDVVGVGSDTAQNALDFLFDGAPGVAGGYNNLGNNHRADNVFATGDANGRAVYDGTCGAKVAALGLGPGCEGTTNQTPNLLPGSVVLRNGTKPVTRPNGSGAGAGALISDGTSNYQGLPSGSIQFARMSRLPNSTEEGNCPTSNSACGGLHVYQFATDNLQVAHQASSYNGPATLTGDDLYHIFIACDYTTWNAIPGNSGGSTATIHPLIPQSGSGTRNFFLADIVAAHGSGTANPGACTRVVEEHDPTGIYGDPSPADAIEPFSTGKLTLINGGYFVNAGYTGTSGNNAYTPGYLTTVTGSGSYNSTRGIYVAIRNADLTSGTPFQAGSTQNYAATLFAGATSYIAKNANKPQIVAAGFTPAYIDCGVNPTTC